MAQAIAADVPGVGPRLAVAITQRSRALGAIDLSRVPWLIDQGVDRGAVRDAVVGEIGSGRRTSVELAAALDAIRGKMLGVWAVRQAIVVRASRMGAEADPRPLLEQARLWHRLPAAERGADYDVALVAILAFGGLEDVVGDLRT